MKRSITILLLLLIAQPLQVKAQSQSSNQRTGIAIGYTSSTFVGGETPGKGLKRMPGFMIGGILEYRIGERLAMHSEALLLTKGGQVNTVGEFYLPNSFIYLQIPLSLRLAFYPGKSVQPFLLGGPVIGFKILAFNSVGVLDDVQNLDIGLNLGGGVSFGKIQFEIRFDRSLRSFDASAEQSELKNHTMAILVKVLFR